MKETLHCYTRVSTRVQEDGTSLDTQKELGKSKSKELGMKFKHWNEGSASSHHEEFLNRPKLMELLIEVKSVLQSTCSYSIMTDYPEMRLPNRPSRLHYREMM